MSYGLKISVTRIRYVPGNGTKGTDRCKSCSSSVQKGDMARHGHAWKVVARQRDGCGPKPVRSRFESVHLALRVHSGSTLRRSGRHYGLASDTLNDTATVSHNGSYRKRTTLAYSGDMAGDCMRSTSNAPPVGAMKMRPISVLPGTREILGPDDPPT